MNSNAIAIYLGCVGLLVGGSGLAVESFLADSGKPKPAAVTQTTLVDSPVAESLAKEPVAKEWPPVKDASAVPFHQEMIVLLTPPPEGDTVQKQTSPANATAPAKTREVVRDRKSTATVRVNRKRPPADDGDDAMSANARGPRIEVEQYRVERERVPIRPVERIIEQPFGGFFGGFGFDMR